MKLYELTTAIHNINEMVDHGELELEDAVDTLSGLEMAVKEKGKNISAWVLNMRSDIQQLKIAEQQMAKRRMALENKEKRLQEYLLHNMEENSINKIECPQFTVSLAVNPPKVVVADSVLVDKLPEKFVTTKIAHTPNKKALKAYLTEGGEVAGIELVRTNRLKWG